MELLFFRLCGSRFVLHTDVRTLDSKFKCSVESGQRGILILLTDQQGNVGSSNFSVVLLICNYTLHALLHR